jgi:BirA family biotin operon repressor/biotin-[acetyl-CoA-carboxylase] ligase
VGRVPTVAETGSTNSDVLALARDGAPEGTWLRAERQAAGRGRQGRVWESPLGNLYASTLVRLRPADPPAPTLALVAAVALHEAATLHCHSRESGDPVHPSGALDQKLGSRFRGNDNGGDARVQIKWPNDLLARTPQGVWAKLAGILLERAEDAVVIGFGVNLAHAPTSLDRPATSLAALTGAAPEPAAFVQTLAETLASTLVLWRIEGLAPIRTRWLDAAHPVGTALVTPAGEGLFDGLDKTGALRLRLADGSSRVIHAGDVFLI